MQHRHRPLKSCGRAEQAEGKERRASLGGGHRVAALPGTVNGLGCWAGQLLTSPMYLDYDFSGKVVGYHKLMIYISALGLPKKFNTHN